MVSLPALRNDYTNHSHFFKIVLDTKFPWSFTGTRSSCVVLYLPIKLNTCDSFTVGQYSWAIVQIESRDFGCVVAKERIFCEICLTWRSLPLMYTYLMHLSFFSTHRESQLAASAFEYFDCMKVLAASLRVSFCDEWKNVYIWKRTSVDRASKRRYPLQSFCPRGRREHVSTFAIL